MPVLLAQCALPPLLLLLVSFVQRRHGPALGGLLAGLPLTSGPVVLFTALHGGAALAGRTAAATLAGVGPVCLLCRVYAAAARRHGPRATLAAALAAFAVTASALELLRPPTALVLPADLLVLARVAAGWPGAAVAADRTGGGAAPGVRMVLVTGWVLAVCALTWRLGPAAVGPFAPFPVLVVVQVAHTRRAGGAAAATAFLRSVVRAEWCFVAVFATLAALLPGLGTAAAFAAALAAGAGAQAAAGYAARRFTASPTAPSPG